MSVCNIKELIEAGVHFGTKSSKWHPKMAPFIHGKRLGVHIIDLKQTAGALIESFHFAGRVASQNKTILFVGTKRQARDVVRDTARTVGMPYVVERWLGGTMTNRETVRTSIKRLDEIEAEMARPVTAAKAKSSKLSTLVSAAAFYVTSKVCVILLMPSSWSTPVKKAPHYTKLNCWVFL